MLPPGAVHRERVVRDDPTVDVGSPDVAGAQERGPRFGVRQDLGRACGPHRGQRVVARRAKGLGHPYALRLGRLPAAGRLIERPVPAVNPVALGDRPVVEPGRLRHHHHRHHGPAAGRFAEDGDAVGVAPERGDVVAHPLEARHHVHDAVVARCAVRRLGRQRRMGEEAEHVEAVVDGDDHCAVHGERGAVVYGARAGAEVVAAAVNPVEDRTRLRRLARCPDVEEQAVLALVHLLRPVLHAGGAGLGRVAHAVPGDHRRWGLPAPVADRRRRERDALEGDDVRIASRGGALDLATGDRHRRVGGEDDLGARSPGRGENGERAGADGGADHRTGSSSGRHDCLRSRGERLCRDHGTGPTTEREPPPRRRRAPWRNSTNLRPRRAMSGRARRRSDCRRRLLYRIIRATVAPKERGGAG